MSYFQAMAAEIILLSSLLLLVPKVDCIEIFGLAGQHIVPSDISGRLFSLDYIEKKILTILCISCIYVNINIDS